MAVRGFIFGVALLALVGWCVVQESFKQTRARYRLAELSRKEAEVKKRLEYLHTQEQGLRSPARLTALVREHKMRLVNLSAVMPDINKPSVLAAVRQPGEVLDDGYLYQNSQNTVDMALAARGR